MAKLSSTVLLLVPFLAMGVCNNALAGKPVDNDGDGYTANKDCNDSDQTVWALNSCGLCEPESNCTTCTPSESTEVTCDDTIDNDCDTLVDAADPDCQTTGGPHANLTYSDYPTACMDCHDGGNGGMQYSQMLDSVHYTWVGPGTDMANDNGSLQGKLTNAMNAYCINILGDWSVCGACHVGRGEKPIEGDTNKANIDCLMCHNEEYAMSRTRLADGSMGVLTPTDSMVRNPTVPSRTNCLKCHAYGGGGNGVKRGDLAWELTTNSDANYDVHMNTAGADLQCTACHSFNGLHKVSGKGSDLRPTDFESEVSCSTTECHPGMDSGSGHAAAGVRGEPDRHVARVACQSCHIPTYAKTATETHRIWRTHHDGQDAETCSDCAGHPDRVDVANLTPVYKFWNRISDNYLLGDPAKINPDTGNTYQTSVPQGDLNDGKLFPFKYKTSEIAMSTDGKIIAIDTWEYLKVSGNVYTSIDSGVANMRAEGIQIGDFAGDPDGWATSDTYQLINHGVNPAPNVADCTQCHGSGSIDLANDSMLDAMDYRLKGVKEEVCGQCHDGSKKLPRTHERMHNHVNKGSGIDCLYCHDFSRAAERNLCSPCDPACDTEFADTNPDYPHQCN
jgi:cytochrome c